MNAVVDTAEENSTVAKVGEYMRAGDDDPDIRVIVLTGVRRGFCSGANLGSRASAGGLNRIIGGAGLGLRGIPQRKSGSHRTRCWRKPDSNPRSPRAWASRGKSQGCKQPPTRRLRRGSVVISPWLRSG